MLPLMYWLDLQDIILMIKCLEDPQDTINIHQYIQFVNSNTREGKNQKMCHRFTRLSVTRNFYFVTIVRIWNSIPSGIINGCLYSLDWTTGLLDSPWTLFYMVDEAIV